MLPQTIGNKPGERYANVLIDDVAEGEYYVIDISSHGAFSYAIIRKKNGRVYLTDALIQTSIPYKEFKSFEKGKTTGELYLHYLGRGEIEESQTGSFTLDDVLEVTEESEDNITLDEIHESYMVLYDNYFSGDGYFGSTVVYEAGENIAT